MMIKLNLDPYLFSENVDGTFKLRIAKQSLNGLSLSENGTLLVPDQPISPDSGTTAAGNRVGNGIAGKPYEICNGPLSCDHTVSRRRKAPFDNDIAIRNEGIFMPDLIRHLNPNYGDDE